MGIGGLRTEGGVDADLSRVMGYIPQEMVKNLKLSGWANMGWSFAEGFWERGNGRDEGSGEGARATQGSGHHTGVGPYGGP